MRITYVLCEAATDQSATFEAILSAAIVSAIVAALVTLGIEWFAKPRLEARKERVVNHARVIREGTTQLLRIRDYSIRLANFKGPIGSIAAQNRDAYTQIITDFQANMISALRNFDAAFIQSVSSPRDKVYTPTTAYLGASLGIALSGRISGDKGSLISLLTIPMLDLWTTPTWRFLARQRHIKTLDAVLESFRTDEQGLLSDPDNRARYVPDASDSNSEHKS